MMWIRFIAMEQYENENFPIGPANCYRTDLQEYPD